ncbi:MAG: TolC family protein [Acidobacteriota bacterium]|nr:MAG: TolC family protein [Acidobacteriota bacterium]
MRKRIVLTTWLACAVPLFGGSTGEASPPAPADRGPVLDDLVEEALRNNPDLRRLAAELDALEAVPPRAGALPDPLLIAHVRNVSFDDFTLGEEEMTIAGVHVSQKFPSPGTRSLRSEVARIEMEQAQLRYEAERLRVEMQVRTLVFDLLYLDRAETVLLESKAYLQSMTEAVNAQYATGRGIQQHAFRAEVALSEIGEEIFAIRQEQESATALLNRTLGRSPFMPLGRLETLGESALSYSLEELERLTESYSPAIAAARLGVERGDAALRLAKRERRPDFVIQGGYWNRGGLEPLWEAFIGVEVPLYARNKQRRQIVESGARLGASEDALEAKRLEVFYEIRDAYERLRRAEETRNLYRDALIPQARASLRSSESAYAVGQVDFDAYLEDFLALLRAELNEMREWTDYEKQIARLKALVGVSVSQPKVEDRHDG